MSDFLEQTAIGVLLAELRHIKMTSPNIRAYLFGSVTKSKQTISDIDLLIVCESSFDCAKIRSELAQACTDFPIHLLLMTYGEEAELKFIEKQRAIEIAQGHAPAGRDR